MAKFVTKIRFTKFVKTILSNLFWWEEV